jgi:hypothetical protein
MATRTTALLTSHIRVTTPDGARTGVIKDVHLDGYRGDQPGQITVRFQRGTVVMGNGSRKPKYWVTVASTATWTVEDEPASRAESVHGVEVAEGRVIGDGITAGVFSGDLFN